MQIREVNVLLTKALLEFPLKDNPDLDVTQYFNKFKTVSIFKLNCFQI